MIFADVMLQISKHAIHMDWDVAFEGKSKGNGHLQRVNKIALYLQKLEGGDKDIVEAGAWLHDIGLVEGNQNHCFKGGPIAREFLEGVGIDPDTITRIIHCIQAHDREIEALTTEAKIVHDADTIDKMGVLGLIRQAWKMTLFDTHEYTVDGMLEFLPWHLEKRRGNIYLKSSKAIVERYQPMVDDFLADEAKSRKTLETVMAHAREGITSDDVVRKLIQEELFGESLSKALEGQLNLDFLKPSLV